MEKYTEADMKNAISYTIKGMLNLIESDDVYVTLIGEKTPLSDVEIQLSECDILDKYVNPALKECGLQLTGD